MNANYYFWTYLFWSDLKDISLTNSEIDRFLDRNLSLLDFNWSPIEIKFNEPDSCTLNSTKWNETILQALEVKLRKKQNFSLASC